MDADTWFQTMLPSRKSPNLSNSRACVAAHSLFLLKNILVEFIRHNRGWGALGHPIPSKRATRRHHPALQCSIPRAPRIRPPIAGAGHSAPPETARPPISKPGMGRSATPMEGARATDAREILVVAILHSYAVSQGGHAPQADFIRLADRCLGAYGTAARRLPAVSGVTRREKLGSGRRDLVQHTVQRSKMAILGSPASNSQRPTSIVGGLAMKQEMNEYFTFDR